MRTEATDDAMRKLASSLPIQEFECRLYVPARRPMFFQLPAESGPKRVARFMPLDYDALVDPAFRRLVAAFESLPQSLPTVRV